MTNHPVRKVFGPLETPLYIYVYEKRYRVTAIFTSMEDANDLSRTTEGQQGVIADIPPFIFMAELDDKGVKP